MRFYEYAIQAILFLVLSSQVTPAATGCDSQSQLCNVQVLIEQYSITTSDYPQLLSRTPSLQQLHLRVTGPGSTIPPSSYPGSDIASQTAQAISQIIAASPGVTIGYHPDISTSSYPTWNCASDPNPPVCSFTNSISLMNAINQQLPAASQIKIYSIEESYPLPQDAANVQLEKKCLQGVATTPYCDSSSVANPAVLYGLVSPSCGDSSLYDSFHFDYGYPQMYGIFGPNNGKPNYTYSASGQNAPLPQSAYPNGQYPADGTSFILLDSLGSPNPYPTSIPGFAVIPSKLTAFTDGDIHSIYEIFTSPPKRVLPNPGDASQTLAALVSNKYGSSAGPSPYPCGPTAGTTANRYFTLSGEPEFFGSSGWSVAAENTFLSSFQTDLKSNGVNAPNVDGMQFAIWSFDTMTGPGNLMYTGSSNKPLHTPTVARGTKIPLLVSTQLGGGLVTSTPKGIVCGRRCSHGFKAKATVTLTAIPSQGYRFAQWGGACHGKRTRCKIRLSKARNVNAEFASR